MSGVWFSHLNHGFYYFTNIQCLMCHYHIKDFFLRYHIDSVISNPGTEQWQLSCFYGEANRSLRYKTWTPLNIREVRAHYLGVCTGNFNEVLRQEEQRGPNIQDIGF